MSKQTIRGRRSRILLKSYRLFLLGDEEALGNLDLPESEIVKMKEFHKKLESGQSAYIAGRTLRIPENIGRGLWQMFCDWRAGTEIRDLYPSNETRPRIARTYELLLSGMSENKIRANGFNDYEIEQAVLFRQFETADILPVTIFQKTDIRVSTVRKLQKIYREHQAGALLVMREEMRAGVIEQ